MPAMAAWSAVGTLQARALWRWRLLPTQHQLATTVQVMLERGIYMYIARKIHTDGSQVPAHIVETGLRPAVRRVRDLNDVSRGRSAGNGDPKAEHETADLELAHCRWSWLE